MPPRTPQSSCPRRALHQNLKHHRPPRFSTFAPSHALIPPESPKYIYIPHFKQPDRIWRPWVKGILPIPRKLFPKGPSHPDKTSPSYLASVTPEPLASRATKAPDPQTADFISWKARQAELRRQNLRESLIELQYRKQRTDEKAAIRSARTQAENKALREAPEREDERLTGQSVLQSERPSRHRGLPDPNRDARLAAKRENLARVAEMRAEGKRDMLHTLYMNAGEFITSEAELEKAVDEAFDGLDRFRNAEKPGLNVWNLGYPETVQDLLGRSKGQKAVDSPVGDTEVVEKRMRRIAEELTGGKMDEAS